MGRDEGSHADEAAKLGFGGAGVRPQVLGDPRRAPLGGGQGNVILAARDEILQEADHPEHERVLRGTGGGSG
jgi:hypothetical protein